MNEVINEFLVAGRLETANELLAYGKEYTKNLVFTVLKLQEQNHTLTDKVMIEVSKQKQIQLELKRHRQGILYYWVTICPDNSKISLDQFVSKIKNTLCKICVASPSFAVIEQRGTIEEDNVGDGFHAHLLLKRTNYENYNAAKFFRNLKNPFCNGPSKCIDGQSKNIDKIFNIQSLAAPFTDLDGNHIDRYSDKLEYIKDMNKWGIEKNDKQHADVIFREENNILPIYEK